MRFRLLSLLVAFAVVACFALPTQAAVSTKFSSSDNLTCLEPLFTAQAGVCKANPDAIAKVSADDCKGPGIEVKTEADKKTCVASKTPPVPYCKDVDGYASKVSGTGAAMTCNYEAKGSRSSPGDYIGDCLKAEVAPPDTNIKAKERYLVTYQKELDGGDKELTLVPGRISWWASCQAENKDNRAEVHKVRASDMNAVGASRFGYAYGFLTMPYKYYPSQRSFQVNVPIGAYLGWRWGAAGSGTTVAGAFTLSSVKADTVDPKTPDANGKPTVTGSTDVTALSLAAGVMFDVLKSPSGQPFKAGIFVGWDTINSDPAINYKFNRKSWVAVQIGYAFTDN